MVALADMRFGNAGAFIALGAIALVLVGFGVGLLSSGSARQLVEPTGDSPRRAGNAQGAADGTAADVTAGTPTDLSFARLAQAKLTGADLRGADLRCAVLRGADLRGANLNGVNLEGADLTGAKLAPLTDDSALSD